MLITEKRLRQIVSSELRRMFLSEATAAAGDINAFIQSLPEGDYKTYSAELNKAMLPFGVVAPKFYEQVKSLIQQGKNHPNARAAVYAADKFTAQNMTDKQKLLTVMTALVTGKQIDIDTLSKIESGKVPNEIGIDMNKFDGLIKDKDFSGGNKSTFFANLFNYLSTNTVPVPSASPDATKKATYTPKPVPDTEPPKPAGSDYTIKSGDTISGLMKAFYGIPVNAPGTTDFYESLRDLFYVLNKVPPPANINSIKPGMKIRLPDELQFAGKTYKRK